MKFGAMTGDIGKNPSNFRRDPKEVQFQELNLLVMWPLDDASRLMRTFGVTELRCRV